MRVHRFLLALAAFEKRDDGGAELLLGTKGYTFGLGLAVRQEDGLAATPGRAGEFMRAGAAGTYFWVDPKEQLAGDGRVTALLLGNVSISEPL